MRPHSQMEKLIVGAATAVHPALSHALVHPDGLVDGAALRLATVTVERLLRTRQGPTSALYITWDPYGRCRYVGSVRRPAARSAVLARLREHLRRVERRSTWYAVTVLPVRPDLSLEVVHECEGVVARRLCPVEGSAHPVPSTERSISDLVAAQRDSTTCEKSGVTAGSH